MLIQMLCKLITYDGSDKIESVWMAGKNPMRLSDKELIYTREIYKRVVKPFNHHT